jgi:2'-5' RNA ligase
VRCFCALELPDAVRAACAAAAAPLRGLGDVKWVAPANLHVTLRFLGEIGEPQVAAMCAAIEGPWPAVHLSLRGLGRFPPHGAPRVLWAGLAGDVDALAATAARLDAAALAAGVPADDKPFHAHVTLGRCKSPLGAARLSAALRERGAAVDGPAFAAERVVLYRSELQRAGPVYTPLAHGACARS